MPKKFSLTKFIVISFAIHILFFVAVIVLPKLSKPEPVTTPVQIVNLPPEILRRLPPVDNRPAPRVTVPKPKKFGDSLETNIPESAKEPDKGVQGKDRSSPSPEEKGPLPFLTQRDIEEFARRGMPKRKQGDESVTLDTNEFKLLSYNRWLKLKVESILRFPELAAISGLRGVTYIQFDIMKDGSLGRLDLIKSSGYKILDDEALRAIRDSAPFQPLPEDWDMERYPIRAAVIFYLSGTYLR